MIAELSIIPMCKSEDTASYLAPVLEKIAQSGLDYQLTATGTLIESDDWDRLMGLIHECHKAVLEQCPRVQTDMRIDDHKGRKHMLRNRIIELEQITGRKFKH